MKNNFSKIAVLLTTLFTAVSQIGFCDTANTVSSTQTEFMAIALKFGKVMLGVLIASVVIYVILCIWNAFLKRSNNPEIEKSSLKSPQNVDDAILFFINKNK